VWLSAGLFVVETCPYLVAILLRLDASIPAQIHGASPRGALTTGCQGRYEIMQETEYRGGDVLLWTDDADEVVSWIAERQDVMDS
jgi:hypothetical protein